MLRINTVNVVKKLRSAENVIHIFSTLLDYRINMQLLSIHSISINSHKLAFVTGYWKISPNVTFYNSNIITKIGKWQLPINSTVAEICSSCLQLPGNKLKYFENSVTILLMPQQIV